MQSEYKQGSSAVEHGWDSYWKGTGDIGAYSRGGATHPAMLAFWNDFFRSVKSMNPSPVMLDLAAGNGAVIQRALAVFGDTSIDINCVDISQAAITNIKKQFPGVSGVVADAASVPLESSAYDVVTSQFGVEYAGMHAFDEAARLVAPEGRLALMMHNRDGAIHRASLINLKAIARVQRSQFIPLALAMFRAGFEAVRGADREPYEQAAARLAPAVLDLEQVMTQLGKDVADGTIAQLYGDVGQIHSRIQNYEPKEVLNWLQGMEGEIDRYRARLESMCESTIDHEGFVRICSMLGESGFSVETEGPLFPSGGDVPLAWVLVARRTSAV